MSTIVDDLRRGRCDQAAVAQAYRVGRETDHEAATELLDALAGLAASGDDHARLTLLDIVLDNRLAHRTVRQILIDTADVDDAVQNTLIAVAERIGQFEQRARFTTWLRTVARNEALMVLRRKQRPTRDTDQLPDAPPGFVERLSSMLLDRNRVRAAVDALPDLQREVLVLREYDGLDYSEIAERLELPIGTVRSRLSRARTMLADSLLGTHGAR